MVKCHNAITRAELVDARTDFGHHAGGFVPINSRRFEQVVLDLLQIGIADSTGLHPHQDLAGADLGRRNLFHVNDARAAINGGVHGIGNGDPLRTGNRQENSLRRARPEHTASAAGPAQAAGPQDNAKHSLQ